MTTMEQSSDGAQGKGLRGRRLQVAVVVASIVAAAVGAALVFGRSNDEHAVTSSVVATLRVPGLPNAISAGPDALWVALNYGPERPVGRLVRLSLATATAEKSVDIDGVPGSAVRVGNSVWVGHNADWLDTKPGELTEVNWTTGEVLGQVPFDRPVFGVASGDGSLWVVVGRSPATLVRVDPTTRHVLGQPIRIDDGRVIGLAFGDDMLWATAFENGALLRIDPSSGRVDRVPVGKGPVGVVASNGVVWVAVRDGNVVARVDPKTLELAKPIAAGANPTWIAASSGSIWVSNQPDGTVSRIDANSGEKIGPPIQVAAPAPDANFPAVNALAAADDGSVWVTSMTQLTVSRIDPNR
jgi:streptogramin lyase